jgi:small conductance mechanosensitive channel
MKRTLLSICTLCLTALCLVAIAHAADESSALPPEPLTTSDPMIPTEELELLLKPLPKDQLLIEADAWQALVRDKAEQIARAEIAVKRQNREIEKAAEIEKQADAAAKRLDTVKENLQQARETGDTEALAEAGSAAGEARAEMETVQASVDETVEAAEATSEARGGLSEATEGDINATVDAAESAEAARDEVAADADDLDGTAERIADVEEASKAEKVALLEAVAELREERTVLLDQFKAVISALEAKTDEIDSETLSQITDYKLYATAVRGIDLDVTDTTSAWLAIKGWIMSGEGGIRWAINLANFFGILIAAWIISGLFSSLIHRGMQRVPGRSRLLEDFLVKAARWIVLAIGLIMALAALEVSVGPLLAVVGAAGFVIAFALQDSLSNFASGMMILFFKPFDVGDVVDAGGVSGTVASMNIASTTIKTFDNKTMVVPNNRIWSDVITNATGVSERRVDMEFGIGYDDDIDRAQAILEEIIGGHPLVLKEPEPTIELSALGESSVNFIARPWAKTEDYWQVFWDVTKAVKQRFDAEGIGIPFPQRDVHLYLEGPAGAAVAGKLTGEAKDEAPIQRRDGGLDD